jgi:hypothetical protein
MSRYQEAVMTTQSFDSLCEEERAYWEYRVTSLQAIVCELLMENEQLRYMFCFFPQADADPCAQFSKRAN